MLGSPKTKKNLNNIPISLQNNEELFIESLSNLPIEILEEYIKEVWKPKPIHNVIPDWATIEKEQIQAIENLIKEYKDVNKEVLHWIEKYNLEHQKYIAKSKVKAKIEKLDKKKRKSQIEYSTIDELIFDKKIEVLQELLEEGE